MVDEKKPMFASVAEAEAKYKELQRQLESARKREKEAVASRMDIDDMKSNVSHLQNLVSSLADRDAGADDAEEKIEKVRKQGQSIAAASEARRAISNYLIENSLDWSDPQLDQARNLYEAGKYSEAVTAMKQQEQTATVGVNADEVAAKVAELLQGKVKVDGGATTASGGIPTALNELRAKLSDNSPAGREWRKAHTSEVLAAARRGELGGIPSRER